MKNRFAEYFKPTEAEVQDLWNTATIVFDTNVLLDLYRYDATTRDEVIQIITFYKERLWIPYQVGWEFHRNRKVVIKQNAEAYDRMKNEFCNKIDELLNNAEAMANNHPLLNISEIKKRSKTFKSAVEKSLLLQKKSHPVIDDTNDVVLNTITELFEGRTGENFSEEELYKIYEEGQKRYEKKIPPGYCDKKEKNPNKSNKRPCSPQELYGDLILWKQIIKWSAEQSVDIILVSSEEKEDWWNIAEDKTKSPRVEMLKEFIEQTHCKILIYSRTAFLENAKKNKDVKVSQRTIKEVEKVKRADTFWITEEMRPTIINARKYVQEQNDFFNRYSALYGDTQKKVYEPLSALTSARYSYLDELHKTVENMGGYSAVLKRIQEAQDTLRSHRTERTLPLQQIDDVVLNDTE